MSDLRNVMGIASEVMGSNASSCLAAACIGISSVAYAAARALGRQNEIDNLESEKSRLEHACQWERKAREQAELDCYREHVNRKKVEEELTQLKCQLQMQMEQMRQEAMAEALKKTAEARKAAENAMAETSEILQMYQEESRQLNDVLTVKNLEILGLQTENQRLSHRRGAGKNMMLGYGKEKEFYEGEIPDLVMSVLEDALKTLPRQSRKRDVIQDILDANDYQHLTKNREKKLKQVLCGYTGMTGKLRSELKELVFQVEETSNHCKVYYGGDPRYLATLASSPSDVRGGKNDAATIARIAF